MIEADVLSLMSSPFGIGLLFWELIWKGFALWRAGRRNEPLWFFVLFILNTLGILPIFYLIFTRKQEKKAILVKSSKKKK